MLATAPSRAPEAFSHQRAPSCRPLPTTTAATSLNPTPMRHPCPPRASSWEATRPSSTCRPPRPSRSRRSSPGSPISTSSCVPSPPMRRRSSPPPHQTRRAAPRLAWQRAQPWRPGPAALPPLDGRARRPARHALRVLPDSRARSSMRTQQTARRLTRERSTPPFASTPRSSLPTCGGRCRPAPHRTRSCSRATSTRVATLSGSTSGWQTRRQACRTD
mmetsp:Transcript_2006/g.6674  ORF Transcript_2006/g.6674 Transcript_2006/m.6674 type:complete len:218 (-) Transcript_2006:1216-1869(-)